MLHDCPTFGENTEELLPEQRTAYIEYDDPKDAEDAARDMDGKTLERAKIRNSTSEIIGSDWFLLPKPTFFSDGFTFIWPFNEAGMLGEVGKLLFHLGMDSTQFLAKVSHAISAK